MMFAGHCRKIGAHIMRGVRRYARDRRGNIATMVALLIIPLVGVMGMATEGANWYLIHRSAQNAADSAVIATAQNAVINPGGTTYISEGRSVAASLGFTNGVNSTIVTPAKGQLCPPPFALANACYKVTVSRNVPISMLRVVGYGGTGGSGTQNIAASAMAGVVNAITNYCILTLGTSGTGIRVNGGPSVDFTGCNLMSDSTSGSATNCNGQNPKASTVSAVGTADANCGAIAHSGATAIADPYAALATTNASDVSDPCGGAYPGVTWNTVPVFTSVTKVCGNVTLGTNIALPSGTVLVIENGTLDLGGNTLSGTGVTLVFNTPAGAPNIAPFANNSGTLDFSAQTSGNWSGVAIYQNRQNGSTATVSQTYAGNKPTWDITGLVYLPYIDLDFKGIVNKSSLGYTCFALVANSLLISGNGAIYSNPMSQCVQAGLVLPNNVVSSRVALVQ
jgi:Flp pilus assembly protein TadG